LTSVVGSSPTLKMVQNYKQTSGACSQTNTEELLTPAHEENVRFIHYTFTPVDLNDVKRKNTQDSKKSS
uniref:Uncharacterized protein n=1 Tax=Cyprinus carpio TaxID=7962 RepID=A0A8C1XZA0_CYPCA